MRDSADVVVSREPFPWERIPSGHVLAISGVLGLVAVFWIGSLRRQIRQRERVEAKLRQTEAATRAVSYFATSLLERNTEEEILWDLARNCVSQLGFADCVIYLLDERRKVLTQKAAFGPKNPEGDRIQNPIFLPLGHGIVGSAALNGCPELVPDTRLDPRYVIDDERRLSEIAVPIMAEGKVLGVIDSEHPELNFFKPEHVDLLTSIASLCANKLVRVRAIQRLHELNQELEERIRDRTQELVVINEQLRCEISERARAEGIQRALFDISEAVHAAADLPSLYARLHAIIGTLMRAENFYIALLDESTGMVHFPYHRDLIDPPPSPRKGGRGMTEYVLRTGRPMLAGLHDIERLKVAGEYEQSGHGSAIWLGVPLTVEGRTFGVMAVQDQHDAAAFGLEDKRILEFVAGQTALAIERKRREEDLVRAVAHERELGELKSRFVSMVSHEFRTPLGIIMSSTEILEAYLDRMSQAEREENLRDILYATRHMVNLMEKVLLLGRGEAGRLTAHPVPMDLADACRRFVEEITAATHERCPIELTLSAERIPVISDESILRHIFINLLDNAVKYSPPGRPVQFQVQTRAPWVYLTVRDTGLGIPEADLRQLFQPFHRGSNVGGIAGTGLGMAIVKYFVQLLGGRIEVNSVTDQGTRFLISLPILPAPPSPPGLKTVPPASSQTHPVPVSA
jgi:K+-sensing histidine kinase KdpD